MTDNSWGGDAPEPARGCLPLLVAVFLALVVVAGVARLVWALVEVGAT